MANITCELVDSNKKRIATIYLRVPAYLETIGEFGCYSYAIRGVQVSVSWDKNGFGVGCYDDVIKAFYDPAKNGGKPYNKMEGWYYQLPEVVRQVSEVVYGWYATQLQHAGVVIMGDRLNKLTYKENTESTAVCNVAGFARWLCEKGWHVTASPIISNPSHGYVLNSKIYGDSMCQVFLAVPPRHFDRALRDTAFIYNDDKLADFERFANQSPYAQVKTLEGRTYTREEFIKNATMGTVGLFAEATSKGKKIVGNHKGTAQA